MNNTGENPFGEIPLFDQGNRLLSPTAALWQAQAINPVHGPKVAVTIRTPSTTLSLLLEKVDAERLADDIARACGETTGLIIPTRGAVIP
jgi:hypothetical protein